MIACSEFDLINERHALSNSGMHPLIHVILVEAAMMKMMQTGRVSHLNCAYFLESILADYVEMRSFVSDILMFSVKHNMSHHKGCQLW